MAGHEHGGGGGAEHAHAAPKHEKAHSSRGHGGGGIVDVFTGIPKAAAEPLVDLMLNIVNGGGGGGAKHK